MVSISRDQSRMAISNGSAVSTIAQNPPGGDLGAASPTIPSNDADDAISHKWARLESLVLGAVGIIAILLLWELAARRGWVNPAFVSSPTRIWSAGVNYFRSGDGWKDLRVSSREFGYGFAVAVLIGIPVGIMLGRFRTLDLLFDPAVTFLYNTPRIAFAPVFVIWFGIGEASKVAVVIIAAVFPVLIGSRAGVASTDRALVDMARSYGASTPRVLLTIVLPSAVPSICAGLRLATGQGLLGVVLAEYVASRAGLGRTIATASATFNTDRLLAAAVVIAMLGLALTTLVRIIERRFRHWTV